MDGLHELYLVFECDPDEKLRWLATERLTMEGVRDVRVKNKFVVVLPFVESNFDLDVGESGCELRVPDTGSNSWGWMISKER